MAKNRPHLLIILSRYSPFHCYWIYNTNTFNLKYELINCPFLSKCWYNADTWLVCRFSIMNRTYLSLNTVDRKSIGHQILHTAKRCFLIAYISICFHINCFRKLYSCNTFLQPAELQLPMWMSVLQLAVCYMEITELLKHLHGNFTSENGKHFIQFQICHFKIFLELKALASTTWENQWPNVVL